MIHGDTLVARIVQILRDDFKVDVCILYGGTESFIVDATQAKESKKHGFLWIPDIARERQNAVNASRRARYMTNRFLRSVV